MKKLVILVTRSGRFRKIEIDESNIIKRYYIGNTVNGVEKYRWNFRMWAASDNKDRKP